jgi:hypothetical protein
MIGIKKKWAMALFALLLLMAALILTFLSKVDTDQTNAELLKKLQAATKEINSLKQENTDLSNIVGLSSNGTFSLPIQTRLGIRLMEGGRYVNYLWVTGEVENTANITLYNARLRVTLNTTNGTDVKEDIIGTLLPHQTVTRRFSAYSSLGPITSWNIEPVATYEP